MNGLLVIDKPGGMTSRDVVNRVQKWFPRKTRIGHTGTLDPLATGVLVVCIGAATRLADYVQAMGKSYASRFRLGATSSTDDADGAVCERVTLVPPSREQIERALAKFNGIIEQLPPAFSAVKVDGQRAHKLARQGDEVNLTARPVRIDAIRVNAYEWPWLDVEIDCGKGTYIRSIARDLGEKLGCGGFVQTLRRTRIGPFTAEQGHSLQTDRSAVNLLPMSLALSGMPSVPFTRDEVKRFRMGQAIVPEKGDHCLTQNAEAAVLDENGELIGIGICDGKAVRPHIVFAMQ